MVTENPFSSILRTLEKPGGGGEFGKYYSLPALNDPRIDRLPYSVRILLESAIRNCDEFQVKSPDVEKIIDWENTSPKQVEIPFKPARVLLQDFTGVPAVVDLACMRDAMNKLGGDSNKINPLVPVDLVIDHSVQVDVARSENAVQANMELEFQRNKERFGFLKWGSNAFNNMLVVPPGSGIVHQVNLEYLGRVVFNTNGVLYPDSVVGTDSHTTMIDGLGVAGWGVGGIEAEAAMLGQPMSMVLPGVVGFKLLGKLRDGVTATDLVLTVTQMLRKHGVVGKFVEFYGEGMSELSLADRATIANMSPEYGATMGFFPVDHVTLQYLRLTGRSDETVSMIESYLRANKMFVDYSEPQVERVYSSYLELNLEDVESCVSGPKRPHDRVPLKEMKADWLACLNNRVGFKGFAVPVESQIKVADFTFHGTPAHLRHGDVVIAAITSCTNTSNPSVMLGAALVAKKACELGLQVKPWIKTSLAPGSGVVTKYLQRSGLQKYLNQLGFHIVGYGCTTCIGNSGDIDEAVASAITENDIVAAAVLSGNRNFEGRVHPLTRANYLASPPLVVAYALAGTVNIDFDTEPIGIAKDGTKIFFNDIWPSSEEIANVVQSSVLPDMFKDTYNAITQGNPMWNNLSVPSGTLYAWDPTSTYIHEPPYFKNMTMSPPGSHGVKDAYCLLNFGDSITTDHISPAGSIHKDSPAARYLIERGVDRRDFNSYGSRRGNDEVMARGTFANIRIVNKFLNGEVGPKTIHIPSGEKLSVFDAAEKYKNEGHDMIILAGAEYGSGSSRDWAAKGPMLLGVKAVIAKSFERIHRSNLVGMGIIPLCFKSGEDADSLGLTGHERYSGFSKGVVQGGDTVKNRLLLETIIRLLPVDVGSVSFSFLVKLLRVAILLECEELDRSELIRRIGMCLEEAKVSDLLIRAPVGDTIFDVDIVQRLVEEFVACDQHVQLDSLLEDEFQEIRSPGIVSDTSKAKVAKLVDGYLAEIARDPHLPLPNFVNLAELVSSFPRASHDGLYRAIDMYLKEHPGISKSEKKRICRLMNCRKLSPEACMHAVQNERLPMRVVVQVLFFEQLRATTSSGGNSTPDHSGSIRAFLPGGSHGSSRSTITNTEEEWDAVGTIEDLKSLKGELDALKLSGGINGASGGNNNNCGKGNAENVAASKMKGLMSKKIMSKIWSSKEKSGELTSSDTSESPASTVVEETKSTPSRSRRHSVS